MKRFALFLGLSILAVSQAFAGLITNGDFEAGLSGWTVTDQGGGSGSWFSQSGAASPLNGFGVAAPPQGLFAAMTDQGGPGSHALIQSFVATSDSVDISFMWFVNNDAGAFSSPGSLDYSTIPNQQARVDLLTDTATAFDLTPGNIVSNLLQTNPGDPAVSGYNLFSGTVTGLTVGNTYQLRFAETDNQLFFNFGVDGVSVDASAPEPATFGIVGAAGLGLAFLLKRRQAAR